MGDKQSKRKGWNRPQKVLRGQGGYQEMEFSGNEDDVGEGDLARRIQ